MNRKPELFNTEPARALLGDHGDAHRGRHLVQLAHGLVDSSFQVIIEFPRPAGRHSASPNTSHVQHIRTALTKSNLIQEQVFNQTCTGFKLQVCF